jgi:hypothetical protein
MNIAIELLVLVAIVIFILFWFFLMTLIKYVKIWRYKPENDKGRRAEESRRLTNLQRPVLSERRVLLPPPAPIEAGRSEDLPRATSNSIRNPFKRK